MNPSDESWEDDARLLSDLGEAIRTRDEVPPRFLQVGKTAFTWSTIDFELAVLTFDSAASGLPSGVRAETASMRALTFTAGDQLTIELELSPDGLAGQLVPAEPASIEARVDGEIAGTSDVDETGWFELRPGVDRPFQLVVRTAAGRTVVTGLITP